MKAKSKDCVQKLEASEKSKTKENIILIAGHKDEMSNLVKSHEKELHVRTIVLCVPLAHIGFIFRLSNFNSLNKLCVAVGVKASSRQILIRGGGISLPKDQTKEIFY